MLAGCYKFPAIDIEIKGVFTNKMATDAYRGAGRPEATYIIERAMDLVARELKMDPVDVRMKNFPESKEFPLALATGVTYDTANYQKTLKKVLKLGGYGKLRREQERLRKKGKYIGLGLSTYVEICAMGPSSRMPAGGWEYGTVRVERTGKATVLSGTSPHGQGEQTNYTFPFGAHLAVVEVDAETGEVRLRNYYAVDDCGRVLNPMLVDGQIHGGLAQGIGQALWEEHVYDENGQLITGTFMDYAVPKSFQFPWFDTANTETRTPVNPLGVKGVGEAGTIGSTPAVVNAVVDALRPFGVRHIDMPLKPEKVWRVMQQANKQSAA